MAGEIIIELLLFIGHINQNQLETKIRFYGKKNFFQHKREIGNVKDND